MTKNLSDDFTWKHLVALIGILTLFTSTGVSLAGYLRSKADQTDLIRVEKQSVLRDTVIKEDLKDHVARVEGQIKEIRKTVTSQMDKGFDRIIKAINK